MSDRNISRRDLIAAGGAIAASATLGQPIAGAASPARPRPITGLYAAGEVSGFGGGGVHGYRALEGTFLGGRLFSGRAAGWGAAAESA